MGRSRGNGSVWRRLGKPDVFVPYEDVDQEKLFNWAEVMKRKKGFESLDALHATPNGGKRSAYEGALFKRTGVKPGYPDISLPLCNGIFYSLHIELKREHFRENKKWGVVSKQQHDWITSLNEYGHYAVVCGGYMEAANTIEAYVEANETKLIELRKTLNDYPIPA